MAQKVVHNTSLLIRDFLLERGDVGATPSEIHRYIKDYKRKLGYKYPNYFSTFKYIYILKELGLIKKKVVQIGYKVKSYYYIVRERADDEAWYHPQVTLYPATRFGSRRYRILKARGREPHGRAL